MHTHRIYLAIAAAGFVLSVPLPVVAEGSLDIGTFEDRTLARMTFAPLTRIEKGTRLTYAASDEDAFKIEAMFLEPGAADTSQDTTTRADGGVELSVSGRSRGVDYQLGYTQFGADYGGTYGMADRLALSADADWRNGFGLDLHLGARAYRDDMSSASPTDAIRLNARGALPIFGNTARLSFGGTVDRTFGTDGGHQTVTKLSVAGTRSIGNATLYLRAVRTFEEDGVTREVNRRHDVGFRWRRSSSVLGFDGTVETDTSYRQYRGTNPRDLVKQHLTVSAARGQQQFRFEAGLSDTDRLGEGKVDTIDASARLAVRYASPLGLFGGHLKYSRDWTNAGASAQDYAVEVRWGASF